MSTLTIAALQLPLASPDQRENIAAVAALVERAAAQGAQVVLPPELFSGPYFCKDEDEARFALARPTTEHPSVQAMQALAARLKIAIPTSFFERDGQHYYNTMAMIGPDGGIIGTYRKSHIPDGPGYEEKYYFRPGNDGFKVWNLFGHSVGVEDGQRFYGHSFITDEWGDLIAEFGGEDSGTLIATLDLARAAKHRAGMGFFRDRRPQLYGRIAQDI